MVREELTLISESLYNTGLENLDYNKTYDLLLFYVKNKIKEKQAIKSNKKLYYFSAEFLIGKLLTNNLINLGIYDEVKEILESVSKDINVLEEMEHEPSLGNGGLGRLAACFLDSIASLNLSGDGIGLNYHLGLFEQKFENFKQKEIPNRWLQGNNFLIDTGQYFPVEFGKYKLSAHMYEILVLGYNRGYNRLHLFDIDSLDESIVYDGINFNKEDIEKNLTLFLYPDDSDNKGKLLRIYQQYFMVSAGAQFVLKEFKEKYDNLEDLSKYVVIQINDTHPTMVIPELIRLLMLEGVPFAKAKNIVRETCAFTNHTILAEALEKWPLNDIRMVAPSIVPIIRRLDAEIKEEYNDPSINIITKHQFKEKAKNDNGQEIEVMREHSVVNMASLAIHYTFSTNGVAKLHTEILKNEELNNFYKIYPQRFSNKTNGVTFRRWLLSCNNDLAQYIGSLIGDGYKFGFEHMEKLLDFIDDDEVLNNLLEIKKKHKIILADYINQKEKIQINPDSIYDTQVKRLHEYKRQQMNALYIIKKYLDIKDGIYPTTPITVMFGAKAAPAYYMAKAIIHLILLLEQVVNSDPDVSKYLKVVMVPNYNVTYAEKLIPATDISEQISLASKEASGTGNMKFMLNGAITLGTLDGANVEIAERVGEDNIYIFGKKSDEVIKLYKENSYKPFEIYEKNPKIKRVVDFINGNELMNLGDRDLLNNLHQDIMTKDYFMALLDLEDYCRVKNGMLEDYTDRKKWAKKMLVNIARSYFFSSDRTIQDYNRDIWKLH